jgi:type IV pilus assembly protein PilV
MERAGMARLDGHGGFSLLEVMTALVVLAVGMLGLAAMQEMALNKNVDANELTVATNLAVEMMERIAYNPKNVSAYNGIDVSSASATCPGTAQMVAGDCVQWRARLTAARLPSVRGTVSVATTGPASLNEWQVTVTISWTGMITPLTMTHIVSLG